MEEGYNYELAAGTPMMKQWLKIKRSLTQNEILFCRVGDFYELFFDDAVRASKILDIQLTKRKIADTTYPMAGVPHRSLDTYLARLVKKGHKVAIIDQLEDAKKSKGTVKRGLTRIVTKGTITEESFLIPSQNNYLAAIAHKKQGKELKIGFAVCDVSTGDFRAGEFSRDKLNPLIRAYIKYTPVEMLHSQDESDLSKTYGMHFDSGEVFTPVSNFWFGAEYASGVVQKHFGVKTTKGYGFEDNSVAISAAGAIIKYLQDTQFTNFPHIRKLRSIEIDDTMTLDATAIKSLELFENTQDSTSFATLLELMDETSTPMGGRLLRHWIASPLAQKQTIDARLESVTALLDDPIMHHELRAILETISDIQRLITRISMKRARPSELIKLAHSLESMPKIIELLEPIAKVLPDKILDDIDPCHDLLDLLDKMLMDDPSNNVGEGNTIHPGLNTELDRLRNIMKDGKAWIDRYIEREEETTGIRGIKIKQNNSLGYFMDISNREESKVPEHYIRKQVMVSTIRYFTQELKDWEMDVLEAEVKIMDLEVKLYDNLLEQLIEYTDVLQKNSDAIANIDVLSSHAYLAERRDYARPKISEGRDLVIRGGRHPVIEAINDTQPYIPNDIILDYEQQRILIITGPNYSGKSSLLRTTALITVMAQVGSYVPADTAEIGIVDRIFTRIGASDNLVAGQSTFMLEMVDAANLVNNSSKNSLIIADELGRGTSTFDGLAIAWSIVEFLHNCTDSPRMLVATHYHQLAELEEMLAACKNYHFVIRYEDEVPKFDHKLVRGSSDKSFGVEVAKLAGLPNDVINRARTILNLLESKAEDVNPDSISSKKLVELVMSENGHLSIDNWFGNEPAKKPRKKETPQPQPKEIPDHYKQIVEKLEGLDINTITPMNAMMLLNELKEILK